jgi:hypothetical protein
MPTAAVYRELASATGLAREQVKQFFTQLAGLVGRELGAKGPGVFTLYGLLKLRRAQRAAGPASQGIHPVITEAPPPATKPARVRALVRALKKLNDLIA